MHPNSGASTSAYRVVVLGSGGGSNCRALLEAERSGRLGRAKVVAVYADREGAGILAHAQAFGVRHAFLDPAPFKTKLEGPAEERYIAEISSQAPDLVVLAGFMRVIKPAFLRAFEGRIINLHPSLLPAFPGLDGIGQAWRRGVRVAGCTVHVVTEGVDAGPILDQASTRREDGDTESIFQAKIHALEHELLPSVVARLSLGFLFVKQ